MSVLSLYVYIYIEDNFERSWKVTIMACIRQLNLDNAQTRYCLFQSIIVLLLIERTRFICMARIILN